MLLKNLASVYTLKVINYLSEILILPFYIKILGAFEFGVFALYLSLAIWIIPLDLGISSTILKEISSKKNNKNYISNLLYTSELIIFSFLLLLMFIFFIYILNIQVYEISLFKNDFATINNKTLLLLISFMLILRVFENIYKNALIAYGDLLKINIYLLFFQICKIVSVFTLYYIYSNLSLANFMFIHLSFLLISNILYRSLLKKNLNINERSFRIEIIRNLYKYSLAVMLIAILNLLTNHFDRIILAKYVKISDYGVYIACISMASIVFMIALPITQYIAPKLNEYYHERNNIKFSKFYHIGAQLIIIVSGIFTAVMIIFQNTILNIWIVDINIINEMSKYIKIILLSNFILVICWMPFQAILATGKLRISVIMNVILSSIMIPASISLASNSGIVGVCYLTLAFSIINFILAILYVSNYVIKGIVFEWLFFDIIKPLLPLIIIGSIFEVCNFKNIYYLFPFIVISLIIMIYQSNMLKILYWKNYE